MNKRIQMVVLIVLFCLGTILYLDMKSWGRIPHCADNEFSNCNITYENFEKISIGDSYDRVVDILGEHIRDDWTNRSDLISMVKCDTLIVWGRFNFYYRNRFTPPQYIAVAFDKNRVLQKK